MKTVIIKTCARVQKVLFLAMCVVMTSCASKGNDDAVAPETAILGKWKLVKTTHPWSGQTFDYSNCKVVFEFRSDNILTISGETVHVLPRFGSNIDEYEYPYSFIDDERGEGIVGLPYGLKIGRLTYWYKISSKKLEINYAPVDGGIDYLVKINQ